MRGWSTGKAEALPVYGAASAWAAVTLALGVLLLALLLVLLPAPPLLLAPVLLLLLVLPQADTVTPNTAVAMAKTIARLWR
ncbi:MAG TPA: hypothetical protein VMB27_04725 [Solirubrobacteraceae bacterium]|nr:hypothetical protein [Solirubrobacteraceae bacterium]